MGMPVTLAYSTSGTRLFVLADYQGVYILSGHVEFLCDVAAEAQGVEDVAHAEHAVSWEA
jgi:hypothetical protein